LIAVELAKDKLKEDSFLATPEHALEALEKSRNPDTLTLLTLLSKTWHLLPPFSSLG
jgi:hypothetical protein